MTRTRWTVLGLLVVSVFVVLAAFGPCSRRARQERVARYKTSCAMHMNYLSGCMGMVADSNPDYVLPATRTTAEAFDAVLGGGCLRGDIVDAKNSCPESFIARGKLGYVYIGDGLNLRQAIDKGWPFLFCPAENHQNPFDTSCRVFPAGWGVHFHTADNARMIDILEVALARAEAGEIPYSARARNVLAEQIRRRREFEQRR